MQAMAGASKGGAEGFFARLSQAFAQLDPAEGVRQKVLMRGDEHRTATLQDAGVDLVETRFGGRADFASRRLFRRQIREFQPHIVLTWMNRATMFCPRSGAKGSPGQNGNFVHVARLGGYYDLKYYRHCDHLIGNTPDIVGYLVGEGWPEDRAHYLPNFVSTRRADPVPRDRFDTPADKPLLLALGRLHENKAFDTLLRAMVDVPDAWLWIGGSGPLAGELEALAADLGVSDRVRFLGWQDDVAPLFAAADIMVCPSRIEPLGNVVLEGWAQSIPVVATRAAGPEQLIAQGETGMLSAVDDAPALASSIRQIVENPALAARIGEAGRAAYEAEFSRDSVVAQYLAFFDKIADNRGEWAKGLVDNSNKLSKSG